LEKDPANYSEFLTNEVKRINKGIQDPTQHITKSELKALVALDSWASIASFALPMLRSLGK